MGYYIGLMSGTSVDGIDACLCQIDGTTFKLIATLNHPYTQKLQNDIHAISNSQYTGDPIDMMGFLDIAVAESFAEAANQLLKQSNLTAEQITAIGSHGQTIRHQPPCNGKKGFSLQIGDPNTISTNTQITTIADFRRKDMALGGQGAPLVPAFHHHQFASANHNRVIVNLGGIANITVLPKNSVHDSSKVIGYDVGPANTLMDYWIQRHKNLSYDENGDWAHSGCVLSELLAELLSDDYFSKNYPKSTGREHFSPEWLGKALKRTYPIKQPKPEDVQRTLLELTAQSLSNAIEHHFEDGEIYLCGGGAYNRLLTSRLKELIEKFTLDTTLKLGISHDWVEAATFAWLAYSHFKHQPSNLPSVTGSKNKAILGLLSHV